MGFTNVFLNRLNKNHLKCPWNKGGVSLFQTLIEIQLRIILLRRYID